ncbi:MAG: lysine--tRNA ligase [Thermoplasmatota archaeon]
MVHWADVEAATLMERHGDGKQVFATAITPSGPIHVGNMREVLTTEAIFRATREAGGDAELIYIADDYDPLRKVYPFLHPSYQEHVGKPLREIPCPDADGRPNGCGDHDSYAAHFLAPFLADLEALGVAPTVLSAYDLYQEGRYTDATVTSFDKMDDVRGIIEEVSKRQLPKRWAPFNPQCPAAGCGRIAGTEVLSYEFPEILCRCTHCAKEAGTDDPDAGTFTLDVRQGGIGKLPWRLDWPARWVFLGVTFEAFGKDHGAAGGSWDTGIPLVRQVFGGQEPHHLMYEFLQLKGKGAMHSSSGLAVSATDMLSMTPPEVLRYLLVRQSPRKHIDFDPGLGILNLVDEFDRLERVAHGAEENPGDLTEVERTYALACPRGPRPGLPMQVPYRHLVTVVQMADDVDGVVAVLRRSGELQDTLDDDSRRLLARRIGNVRYWLDHFAPEATRFQVQPDLPADLDLAPEERGFLADLATRLDALPDDGWTGQSVHDAIYDAKDAVGIKPGQAFRAVYRAVLGQDRGPRAGFFVASLDKAWVVGRFGEAAG